MKKPDYSLGSTAIPTVTQQPQTLSASVTVGLNLRDVGAEAARAVGMTFLEVAVEAGPDASDEPAYFFMYVIPSGETVTGKMRSHLLAELRDRLLAYGDSHYPYVKLTAR